MLSSSSFYSRFGKDFPASLKANTTYGEVLSRLRKGDFALYGSDDGLSEILDDISHLFDALLSIAYRPRTSFKDIDVLLRSELSPALRPEEFLKTVNDPSLWRRKKNGTYSPEYVHSTAHEEDIDTYENRGAVTVYGEAMAFLYGLKKSQDASKRSLERLYGLSSLPLSEAGLLRDLRLEGKELSTYLFSPSYKDDLSSRAEELERKGRRLAPTPLMRALSSKKIPLPLFPTNIYVHDPRYREVYSFFLRRLSGSHGASGLPFYFLLRFLEEGRFLKFTMPVAPTFNKRNGKITCSSFRLEKGDMAIDGRLEGNSIILETSYMGAKDSLVLHCYDELREADVAPKGIHLCLHNLSGLTSRYIEVAPDFESHSLRPLYDALFVSLPLSGKLERCPVCGRRGLRLEGEEYLCPDCGSRMSVLTKGNKNHLWLKELW